MPTIALSTASAFTIALSVSVDTLSKVVILGVDIDAMCSLVVLVLEARVLHLQVESQP